MPSGRVLNSGGPPKIICDAMVPPPLEPESDELDPQPLSPIVRAVAAAARATSLVFMFSPGGFHLGVAWGLSVQGRARVGVMRPPRSASWVSAAVPAASDAASTLRPVMPRETV